MNHLYRRTDDENHRMAILLVERAKVITFASNLVDCET